MKFGCCADRAKATLLKGLGFDYIELGVSNDLDPINKEASPVDAIASVLREAALPVEAFNFLIPASLKVTGPNRDLDALIDYMTVACGRAKQLGGKILVFGSGGARGVPEGYDFERAHDEIVEFLRDSADIVEDAGLIVAIEPLQKAECNIINSVADGVALVRAVGRTDAILVLSDLYHVSSDDQPFAETADAGTLLRHVHVACGADRHPPGPADVPQLTSYFQSLKQAGYDGRVSIEANWTEFEKAAEAGLAAVKTAWDAAEAR